MAPLRHRAPRRRAASGRRTADPACRLSSSRGYDRGNCGRRNTHGAPETCRRPRPATRSRQSRAIRVAQKCSRLRPRLRGNLPVVPIEELFAVPVQHAVELLDVVVDGFEVFDTERLTADVRMHRERKDLRPNLALFIEPVET